MAICGPRPAPTDESKLLRRSYYRYPADEKFPVYDAAVRNADHIESGTAIVQPALRHRVELLGFDAKHLGGDDELRASLLSSHQVVEGSHASSFCVRGGNDRAFARMPMVFSDIASRFSFDCVTEAFVLDKRKAASDCVLTIFPR
jgi:hypothetical protein